MEQELEYLGRAVANPEHPYIAILGGAKISDKILVVETLLSKCDKLIIGGGMGAELRQPLGITLVGGLLLSQLLTLFTTPVIYLAFDRLATRWSKRLSNKDLAA